MSIELPSVCPMDCPDTCSLLVTVEDDKVVKVRGSHANPLTNGIICNKISRGYPEFVHGPNRLTTPLKRTGAKGEGEFEAISWDEALDTVTERFIAAINEYGAEAVVPFNYAGPHGKISGGSMDSRMFNKMGATQLDRGPLCAGVRGAAYASLYGGMPGNPLEQAQHSKLIVVWGNNVTVSNLHLSSIIALGKRNGAKLVVIDPKRIKIAEQADLHLAISPGSDVMLAMVVAAELERRGGIDKTFVDRWVHGFDDYMAKARKISIEQAADVCGLRAEDILTFVKMYHEISPAIMSIANGMERSRNGGNSIRSAAVLPALAGKFGVLGGGLIMKAGNAFPETGARLQQSGLIPDGTRTFNIIDVADHILDDTLDPPVKALFIYNHNPVAVHPNQNHMKEALLRDDLFIVGCDIEMTDSMAYADIILPASSHFEFADLYGAYGQQYLQRADPVIPSVGDSLPNTEIFRRLSAKLGYDNPIFRADDAQLMDDAMDATDPRLKGVRPSEVPLDSAIYMEVDGEDTMPFVNVFPGTETGKVEILSDNLESLYGEGVPEFKPLESEYPFYLITPSSDKRINATFGGLKMSDEIQPLEMNPTDAAARRLTDGVTVKVWNQRGEVHLKLAITDAVPAGTLYSPKGAWFKTSATGQTVSALTPSAQSKADIAGGACYNDARVDIAPV
jgi:anaerobic selenocysteine-containing dehydrogenase